MGDNKLILMAVCNYFDPDNRVFRAAETTQSAGYIVKLLAYHRNSLPENEILGSGFELFRLKTKDFIRFFPQFNNWIKRLIFKRKAKKFADEIKPEVVHCHDYNTLFLGIYCKKKYGSKLIYDCHEYFQDLNYLHRYPLLIRKKIARFERRAIKNFVDQMIVVSPGISDLYQEFLKSKIHIVRNIPDFSSIDVEASLPHEVMEFLEDQQNRHRKLFLYLGTNTQKGRGMDFVFGLMKKLPDDFGMVSFGARSQREIDSLMTKAVNNKIQLRYKAFLSLSAGQLFTAAKYCYMGLSLIEPVYISYLHSLPNKLFEYFAMGLPVLSSDIPDQSELVSSCNAGLVIPFNSDKAKEIILKAGDRKFNTEIRSLFTWKSEKEKLISVYDLLS